jgi:hypothetical protein
VNRKAITFKVRYIYIPLLVLAARVLTGYSFLNWLLVIRSSLVPASDNVVDYWVPLACHRFWCSLSSTGILDC